MELLNAPTEITGFWAHLVGIGRVLVGGYAIAALCWFQYTRGVLGEVWPTFWGMVFGCAWFSR